MKIKIYLGVDSIELDVNPSTTTIAELRQQALEAFKRNGFFNRYPRHAREADDPELVLSLDNKKLSGELYLTQTAYQAGSEFKFWKDHKVQVERAHQAQLLQEQARHIMVNFYAPIIEAREICLQELHLPDVPEIDVGLGRIASGGAVLTDLMGDTFNRPYHGFRVYDDRPRVSAFFADLASSVKSLIWSSSSSSQNTQQDTPATTTQNDASKSIELKKLSPTQH